MSLVQADSIVKHYQRGSETVHALSDATFALEPREVVALIGPSGSGKSTLLNVLSGWEAPDSGDLLWDGDSGQPPQEWKEVAIVPQKLGLIAELSIEENVTLPLRLLEEVDESMAPGHLIGELGLSKFARRLPHEISVGEQQRTALARALVLAPALLLLDEPTGHQDAAWVTRIFEMLREAAANGSCVLVATHNPEVLPHCDRTLEIRDGTVL